MRIRKAFFLLLALVQSAISAEDYYKILGISKSATDREIKSAYRQLSKKFHPDKNPGDATAKDKFVEVSEAYEALADPEMRQIYDQHGHDGVQRKKQGGGFQAHDPFDIFSRFFGGGGHFGNQPGQRRGPNVEIKLAISLRDYYNGASTEFQWEKQHICEECEGTGSADGEVEQCSHCGGHGIRIVRHQLAPGMFQQMQTQCDQCGGRGKTIRHKCPVCDGERVVRKSTTVPVTIDRGAAVGKRIVYENEADASPDYVAGDLLVYLVERESELEGDTNPDKVDGVFFRRRGDDLFWKEVISLREAWMGGWTRNITHLDGHVVKLGRERGQVVQPGHVEALKGEGMPVWHEDGGDVYHQTEFGNLFVEYTVVIPDQMESGMEKEFWSVWQKWRGKNGVDLQEDSGRPEGPLGERAQHDEL